MMKLHTVSALVIIFSASVTQAAECKDNYFNQIKGYSEKYDQLEEEYAGMKGKKWCGHIRIYSLVSEQYVRWLDSEPQCETQNKSVLKKLLERNIPIFQKMLEQCSRARL